MNAHDLILNIAVNLGRMGRWVADGKTGRVKQFMTETEGFLDQLSKAEKSARFEKTFRLFEKSFENLKKRKMDDNWAEEIFTWANILVHRAKLA
ncbi:MAG: hypothetical protein ACD_57C00335G0004 [uncultured bacterium]|nr:MAG: hypothetical protein ACD_57C00335G0004 [uncultured bacterium]OGD93404.1 MAG: hypothetical protein A3E14_03330 [Candidatus Curtissbacteria bacterium RIFCSPHIGHO2_12_FULL_41_13]